MSSSIRATLWELFRTSRLDLLTRVGYSVAIVLVLNSIRQLAQEDLTPLTRGLLVIISIAASSLSLFWIRELDRGNKGFSFRMHFVRPISTMQLVAVPMLFTVATSAICFLVPTQLHELITGVPMPVWGPLAFVGCVVVCLTGAAWSATTIPDTIILLGMLFVGLFSFLIGFHQSRGFSEPFVLAIGDAGYFQFGWVHYAVLLGVAMLAFGLTVIAVDRQRHGEGISLVEPVQSLFSNVGVKSATRASFRGPLRAQFGYEFRRTAPTVLTIGIVGPLCVLAFVRFGYWMNPDLMNIDTIWQGAPVMWMLALGLGPFLYQLIGADGVIGLRKRGEVYRLSAFDATVPMANDQLIAIKLVVVAVCSLIACGCMWLAAWLDMRFGLGGAHWPHIVSEIGSLDGGRLGTAWWLGGIACATLFYIGSTSILLGFGLTVPFYPRVFTGLMCFGYVSFGLAFMDSRNNWEYLWLWRAYGFAVAAVIALLGAFAIWLAVRQRAMSARSMLFVTALWCVFVGVVIVLAQRIPSIGTPMQFIVASLLLVPLAATVCGPLALGLQRHRL